MGLLKGAFGLFVGGHEFYSGTGCIRFPSDQVTKTSTAAVEQKRLAASHVFSIGADKYTAKNSAQPHQESCHTGESDRFGPLQDPCVPWIECAQRGESDLSTKVSWLASTRYLRLGSGS